VPWSWGFSREIAQRKENLWDQGSEGEENLKIKKKKNTTAHLSVSSLWKNSYITEQLFMHTLKEPFFFNVMQIDGFIFTVHLWNTYEVLISPNLVADSLHDHKGSHKT